MSDISDIANSIRKLADNEEEVYCITAKVITVDENNRTCTVEPSNGKSQLQDVRLQSTPKSMMGLCLVPEIGSYVLIGFITKNEAVVLLAEKLAKIICNVDLIEFNRGELGGMVKLLDAVSRFNIIEQDLNTIKTAFNSWVPVPNDGGAALKTIATTWSSNFLTNTSRTDLENEKIKQ